MGLGWREWSFMIVSFVNLLLTLGLTIDRLVVITDKHQTSTADFTFAILILANAGN